MFVKDGRVRILVVNDEHIVADTLALVLEKSGFEVIAVYSGRQAVERAQSWTPHVLIIDIVYGSNGLEAADLILKDCPTCKVVMFAGHAATADGYPTEKQLNQFEVLTKPVHPQTVIDRVTELIS